MTKMANTLDPRLERERVVVHPIGENSYGVYSPRISDHSIIRKDIMVFSVKKKDNGLCDIIEKSINENGVLVETGANYGRDKKLEEAIDIARSVAESYADGVANIYGIRAIYRADLDSDF